MRTYNDFADLVALYRNSFKKCNVTASTLCNLQSNYTITEKLTRKEGRKITQQKTENVSAEYFAYVIASVGFFHDRVEKAYTMPGYLSVKFTAKNPYANESVIREYAFNPNH